jgi:hypothetical protein
MTVSATNRKFLSGKSSLFPFYVRISAYFLYQLVPPQVRADSPKNWVILATGLSQECAHGSIRISLGRQNTMEDIAYMLDVLPKVIRRIRGMSTAYARRQ